MTHQKGEDSELGGTIKTEGEMVQLGAVLNLQESLDFTAFCTGKVSSK